MISEDGGGKRRMKRRGGEGEDSRHLEEESMNQTRGYLKHGVWGV